MSKLFNLPDNLKDIMIKRYYQPGEEQDPSLMLRRVANFVAFGEKQYGWSDSECSALAEDYFKTMNERLWIPSSPFLMSAGTKVPMLFACFVLAIEDTMDGIFETLKRAANIWKMGGGTGFNFSKLREKGAEIKSTGGTSTGILSWMRIYNVAADAVKQGGKRRAANMGILNYNHPEILDFIDCKLNNEEFTNFNLSVLVDDDFMNKVEKNESYDLVSPATGIPVGQLNAKEVFDRMVKNAHTSADPGIIWVDSINTNNPMIRHMGQIEATNPCGEQPLYPDEACDLASINLEEFVDWDGTILLDKLRRVVSLAVRFLDTAIDVNIYPDELIEQGVKNTRKIGLGIMSLAGALIKAGYKYSGAKGRAFAMELMNYIQECAWDASIYLANKKGKFPLHTESNLTYNARNCACTTVAPTGTIQQMLDTSSAGCEPIFAIVYERIIDDKKTYWVNPFFKEVAEKFGFWNASLPDKIFKNKGSVKGIKEIPQKWQDLFETAMEIKVEDHIKMQSALQKYVDAAISKTINLPANATEEEVGEAFMHGWKLGLKGMTVYRDGSKDSQVLSVGTEKEKGNETLELGEQQFKPEIIEVLGRGEIIKAPKICANCREVQIDTGCGTMYLTMTKDDNGDILQTFIMRGSKGTCQANQNAVSRLTSLCLRGGISVEDVVDQLQSIPPCAAYIRAKAAGQEINDGTSCPSAIAEQLQRYANIEKVQSKPKRVSPKRKNNEIQIPMTECPECKAIAYVSEGGCGSCKSCGYSKCG